jgi:hypothetical protein
MFNIRTTALALAAIASIGAASFLSSSSAEARGFGGGFARGGGGVHVGGGFRGNVGGMRRIGGGPRFVGQRGPRFVGGPRIPRPLNWCHLTHRCGPHFVRWHRPWVYGVGAVAATTYAVAPPTVVASTPRPCTCLTKEYTPDNLVVFQDVCTKEVASAPIGNTQAQLPLPQQQQAPVQQ